MDGPSSSSAQPANTTTPPPSRKLVSVRQISQIERVPSHGNHLTLHLDGWRALVDKRRMDKELEVCSLTRCRTLTCLVLVLTYL